MPDSSQGSSHGHFSDFHGRHACFSCVGQRDDAVTVEGELLDCLPVRIVFVHVKKDHFRSVFDMYAAALCLGHALVTINLRRGAGVWILASTSKLREARNSLFTRINDGSDPASGKNPQTAYRAAIDHPGQGLTGGRARYARSQERPGPKSARNNRPRARATTFSQVRVEKPE